MAVYFTFGGNAGIITGVLKKNGAIAMNSLSLRINNSSGESLITLDAGQMAVPHGRFTEPDSGCREVFRFQLNSHPLDLRLVSHGLTSE